MKGIVRKVHALIEVNCPRCGKPSLQLWTAPVVGGQVAYEAEIPDDAVRDCNDCQRADREAEDAKYQKSFEQRRWAKGKPPTSRTARRGA